VECSLNEVQINCYCTSFIFVVLFYIGFFRLHDWTEVTFIVHKWIYISLLVCGTCLWCVVLVSDVWYLSLMCGTLFHVLWSFFDPCSLTYTNSVAGGSICPNGGRHSMHIEFLCSRVVGVPVFMKETADCVHHFLWETPVSCPSLVIKQWTDLSQFKLVTFNPWKTERNLNYT
jgi:hypothetical protein